MFCRVTKQLNDVQGEPFDEAQVISEITDEAAELMNTYADENHDGKVSKAEFLKFIAQE